MKRPPRSRAVRFGPRDDGCPLCRMTGAELAAFWAVMLEDGEAFVPDPRGGYRRYELGEFEDGTPEIHFEDDEDELLN